MAGTPAENAAPARRAENVRGRAAESAGRELRAVQYLSRRRHRAPASPRPSDMKLADLNRLSDAAAQKELLRCCASHRWAHLMSAERPFANSEVMAAVAQRLWWSL